jgi:hypothetical protein
MLYCYGGVSIPIINTIFIESKYDRLSRILILDLSYPKTESLAPFCKSNSDQTSITDGQLLIR